MNPHTGHSRRRSKLALAAGPVSWLTFALATLVLASPLKLAWARPALGWIFPFLLWTAIILAGALSARFARDDDRQP